MKKILLFLSLTFIFTSCTKDSIETYQQAPVPSATIISVNKVYAGANSSNLVTYSITSVNDVDKVNFIISGSTVLITVPVIAGKNTIYDRLSPIGPVLYSFLFTMKNGSQIPTPVQIFNP